MSWWGWLLLAGYIAGYLWAVRVIAWAAASDFAYGKVGGEDIAMGLTLGLMLGFFWPFLIIVRSRFALAVVKPRSVKHAEREKELQKRIAELERETGIRA